MEIDNIRKLIENYLVNSVYLVNVDILPNNRIVVTIDSDNVISTDDCVALTKHIESQLDRNIEDYELEVGSVGISQPLKIFRQYRKNISHEVEILLQNGKKITGILKEADENKFILTTKKQVKPESTKRKISIEENLEFSYNEIKYTKPIIRL